MGIGSTIGGIAGGIGGFVVGGPGGALLGYGGGSALGGAFDDQQDAYGAEGARVMPRDRYRYGGLGADAEAERSSQLGQAGAKDTRWLGRELGGNAESGMYNAGLDQRRNVARAGGLYDDANASYGRAEGNAADAAAARGDSMAAIGRLRSFYEGGPGPSAAQAQLVAGRDSANRNALALANTGAGGANSMRAAMRAGATSNQQTNQAAASLRANEAAAWNQTKLGAMGMEQGALGNVRAGDVGIMGQRYGAAGQQMGAAGAAGQVGLGYGQLGAGYNQQNNQARLGAEGMAIGQTQAGEQGRQGILAGDMGAANQRYGADRGVQVGMANVAQRDRAADMAMTGTLIGAGVNMMSDVRAKENIQPVSAGDIMSRLKALESTAAPSSMGAPAVDMRPASSTSWNYKNQSNGPAASYVSPMAQELEQTPAAGAVSTGPDGMKSVDPGRLTMVNTSAIGEQQRRLDALEAMVADKAGADFEPKGAQTNGQRVIRKIEAVTGDRMDAAAKRRMSTFGGIGSIKPEDEEYIRQSSPKRTARRAAP